MVDGESHITLSAPCVSDFLASVIPSIKQMLRTLSSNPRNRAVVEESTYRRACVEQILLFFERYGIHTDCATYIRNLQQLWNVDRNELSIRLDNHTSSRVSTGTFCEETKSIDKPAAYNDSMAQV